VLPGVLARPWWARGCAWAVIFAATIPRSPIPGEEFIQVQGVRFMMHWVEKPGHTLEAMQRITGARQPRTPRHPRGAQNLRRAQSGRASRGRSRSGPTSPELWISLDPQGSLRTHRGAYPGGGRRYPGLYRDLLTLLEERIKEVLSGGSAAIVVRLFGRTSTCCAEKGEGRGASPFDGMGRHSGASGKAQVLVPQIEVAIRQEERARFGAQLRRTSAALP